MTWGDLKRLVLQKVFAISDGKVVEDDTTREYLTAMPGAANEGLQLLATAGRFMKKKAIILQGVEPEPEETAPVFAHTVGEGIRRYDLAELIKDFYGLDEDGVYLESGGAYCRDAGWTMEAGHVFVLPAERVGKWTLWYNAYPPEMKENTPDSYDLPLFPEVAALLPLYIASQVYKDDDVSMATQYRNEFEVGRDELRGNAQRGSMGRDNWTSGTGWF